MSKYNEKKPKNSGSSVATKKKKPYRSPELTHFGDVRDVTLGGSLPGAESGLMMSFP